MEQTKVIFRKIKAGFSQETEVIAFLPEVKVNVYKIMSYMHTGQHSEASHDFYKYGTVRAEPNEYWNLYEELTSIYGKLRIMEKLQQKDMKKAWGY